MNIATRLNSNGTSRVIVTKGDKYYIHCNSGHGTGGPSVVTNINIRYDEVTGEGFHVVWFGEHGFRLSNGEAYNPPTEYHVDFSKKLK